VIQLASGMSLTLACSERIKIFRNEARTSHSSLFLVGSPIMIYGATIQEIDILELIGSRGEINK
jgi:hypothetical protein